ncbi:MAG: ATP-binding cassette domain-containing protein, partial [Actinomycetes bacterium]
LRARLEPLTHDLPERRPPVPATVVARLERVGVRRGPTVALRDVTLDLRSGEVLAVMGRNGAGKSTLFGTLVGLHRREHGQVALLGGARAVDPQSDKPTNVMTRAGLVPRDPGDLLYADSVAEECREADRDAGAPPGTTVGVLERLAPGIDPAVHPRDLSEGQRLALALAIVLAASPPLLLLDEPTRGLDYAAKSRLVAMLSQLAAAGHAVVLSTHDVELVAELADRVVVLAEGEVVADGPTADVVVASPAFAPQVAKILAPQRWLTVRDVAAALGRPLPEPEPAGAA